MEFPGERLVLKLWETLAEKGVGGLLKPWQQRRVGHACTDVKANEIVMLAKAQAEANRIACDANIPVESLRPLLESSSQLQSHQNAQHDLEFDPELISRIVATKDQSQSIRREANVANAVLVAEDVLAQSEAEPRNEPIEDDCLFRWEEYAGQVSSEELQELWGRVLAGEIAEPGSKSLRLLEFLKTISKSEAQLVESLGPYVFNGIIARDQQEYLAMKGLVFGKFLQLQELGIMSSVDSIGVVVEYASSNPVKYSRTFVFGDKVLYVEHEDVNRKLKLPSYGLTSLGQQVLSLGCFDPDYEYFLLVAKRIASLEYNVQIGDWEAIDTSHGRMSNAVVVEA